MPLRNITWLMVAALVSLVCYGEAQRNRYAGILSETIQKISAAYVEPVDRRALFEGGLRGMLAELDPYSSYIAPEDYDSFRVDIEQHFGGIGIEVGMEQNRLTVLNPVPDTPAYEAGLMAGDTIVSIDGINVEGFSLTDAVKLMRGRVGTPVKVGVLHAGDEQPTEYTMVRADIRIDSVRGDTRDARGRWKFVLEEAPEIGYIRLNSFGDRTATELHDALETLDPQTVKGLIIDLRRNAGGLLSSAVEVCDMFLPEGQVIVSTRGRDHQIAQEFRAETEPIVNPQLPLVILVDRFSASASEIVAACLQDHERAVIVGERTWGKGTVQNVFPIESGRSAIKLTTQTYWRPSGENIHRGEDVSEDEPWGVRPQGDNLVTFSQEEYQRVYQQRMERDLARTTEHTPSDEEETDAAEDDSTDRQLQRALDVLKSHLQAPIAALGCDGSLAAFKMLR